LNKNEKVIDNHLTVYPLNALSKDKREIEITSIGMKFVCIPPVEG
jgi:hypothetical protein